MEFVEPDPLFIVKAMGGVVRPDGQVDLRIAEVMGKTFQLSIAKAQSRVLPPGRGTAFSMGDTSYLYTSGYLTSLGRYPHGHVPSPLQIADHVGDTSRTQLLRDSLVLTKMNWNSANFAGLMPITLRFSRLVGDILREVPSDQKPEPKYKYYM